MSMDTENNSLSDSQTRSGSNVPYYGSYGSCSIFDYPSQQMPYAIPMHADQQYPPNWVNPNYPIHGSVGRDQATYVWHINNYLENYASTFSWKIIVRINIEMYLIYLNQQGIHFGFKFQTRNVLLIYYV